MKNESSNVNHYVHVDMNESIIINQEKIHLFQCNNIIYLLSFLLSVFLVGIVLFVNIIEEGWNAHGSCLGCPIHEHCVIICFRVKSRVRHGLAKIHRQTILQLHAFC